MAITSAELLVIKTLVAAFNDPGFLFEIKMDGFRCLATNPPPKLHSCHRGRIQATTPGPQTITQ